MFLSSYEYSLNSLDGHLIEASRSLGRSRWATLREVIVPLLLPAFLSSGFLVLMEVISDFGTVMVFSYPTLTTAIFKSWYGFFDLAGALQLASISMDSQLACLWQLQGPTPQGQSSTTPLRKPRRAVSKNPHSPAFLTPSCPSSTRCLAHPNPHNGAASAHPCLPSC